MSRTIIRNARLIPVPGVTGVDRPQDLVIEDDRIVAIGAIPDVADAEIVDATDCLVLPGLVNAHMHGWQTALRGTAGDWALPEYLLHMHGSCAPHYTPDDVYVATLAAALGQIVAGTTLLGDWFHNNITPEHSDAAVAALRDSGIRAVLVNGTLPPRTAAHSRAEAERLMGTIDDGRGLLRFGMAIAGPHYTTLDVAKADLLLARDLGDIIVSMHHSSNIPGRDAAWHTLLDDGLFGPTVNIVHGNHIDDALLARLVDAGVTFTVTPEVELACGHGDPITGRLRALGAAPSIGIDIESAIGGEMLVAARMALVHQRGSDHAQARAGKAQPAPLRNAEALGWVTVEGARALGWLDSVGTLAPGKQADLIVIDTRAPNLWGSHDAATTALNASIANIDSVMIAGQWRKRDGKLLWGDTEPLRRRLVESGQRIAAAAGLPVRDAG